MAAPKQLYKPGEEVTHSGVYRVVHDRNHTAEHDVTVVAGRHFPPCNHCGHHPRFVPVRLAWHVGNNDNFK